MEEETTIPLYYGIRLNSKQKLDEEMEELNWFLNNHPDRDALAPDTIWEFIGTKSWRKSIPDLRAFLTYWEQKAQEGLGVSCLKIGSAPSTLFLSTREGKIEKIETKVNEYRESGGLQGIEGSDSKKPYAAVKKMSPKGFTSCKAYVEEKMAALIGASARWASPEKEQKAREYSDYLDRGAKLRKRLDSKDESGVFPSIYHDIRNLAHPFALKTFIERIEKLQSAKISANNEVERNKAGEELRGIGIKLDPDMRGRGFIPSPEEMIKYCFEREWVWYHALFTLYSSLDRFNNALDAYKALARSKTPDPRKTFESYGLSSDYLYRTLGERLFEEPPDKTPKVGTKYKTIAFRETAKHYGITVKRFKNILSNYCF